MLPAFALSPLLVCLAACGSGGPGPQPLPSVILIVVDALRADHLGCYGYGRETSPSIDRLAGEGALFEVAVATSSRTRTSMASLLTSLHPVEHGVRFPFREAPSPRSIREAPENLPRLIQGLQENLTTVAETYESGGYETVAIVTNPYLKQEHGFGQGFQTYVERELDAQEVVGLFLDWLDRRSEGPFFALLHFIDVHFPYSPGPPYDAMFREPQDRFRTETAADPADLGTDGWLAFRRRVRQGAVELDAGEIGAIRSLYDGEIRRVDDALGRLLARLERDRLLDSSLIALTSDHGDEFLEHGQLGHGYLLYDNLIRVPLIFRLPGGGDGGRRLPGPVSQVDVMPTLLDLSGLEVPGGLSGRSQAAAIRSGPAPQTETRPVFSELIKHDFRREAIRTGRYKLIRTLFFENRQAEPDGEPAELSPELFLKEGKPVRVDRELYDLDADPGELRDLSDALPATVEELESRLDRHLGRLEPRVDLRRVLHRIDPEMEERLRGLGYLE